tara:strand:+ start:2412 stop:2852 length:441 start_codon:yes stop_codon:yes gene_type:complete
MAHARQTIRERFVTLVTGLSTTGSNVFDTRLYNLTQDNLPALVVVAENETSELDEVSPGALIRNLEIICECFVEQNNDIEDTMDNICEEVEEAIGADPTLNGTSILCELTTTEIEYSSLGEKPIGTARMVFNVSYKTSLTNSSTPL